VDVKDSGMMIVTTVAPDLQWTGGSAHLQLTCARFHPIMCTREGEARHRQGCVCVMAAMGCGVQSRQGCSTA